MSWLENAVFYQIIIDRFAGFKNTNDWEKPVYVGGNIKGITDKLSYIKQLGVNAIWISPFNTGVAYHGYHITDFFGVDSHFGDEKDLENLIESAHDQDIKIICDFVPNHCSNKHPFFMDAVKNENSKYHDWFIFKSWPDKYLCFRKYKELPKLNLDNKETRLHLLESARKWLKLGFDGFRIDHVIGISNDNLNTILTPLRTEFPGAVFIGEAWFQNTKFNELNTINVTNKYLVWLFHLNTLMYKSYANILDGYLDFDAINDLEKYAHTGDEKYRQKATNKHKKLENLIKPVTFLDNHDMERVLFRLDNDVDKLKNAIKMQFSLGIPTIIYYGTEIGMSQEKPFSSFASYGDILAREPMRWDMSNQNLDLLKYYQKLIRTKVK